MLKELKQMLFSNPMERIRVLQETKKVAFQAGFMKGYEAGKNLHQGDCTAIKKTIGFEPMSPKDIEEYTQTYGD